MTNFQTLFPTRIYRAKLGGRNAGRLNRDLLTACQSIARDDLAGRRWSDENGYHGYTSYASLNDLTVRAPQFGDLVKALAPHIKAFEAALNFDLQDRSINLDSMWINVLKPGGVHTSHIHPHSVISGTYYVEVPEGSSALKFEDPRLGMMMAAPPRRTTAPREEQPFVYIRPSAGTLILFESWLRHEVPLNMSDDDRISISFNYNWS
jgi:uncharacterized protein (TIGR02466 family)